MTKKMRSGGFLLMLAVLFLGMFAAFGPKVYNDSGQYINMHIHREPLYPLLLALLRAIFGDAWWLTAMGVIQNLFAAFSIWLFAEYMTRKFSLGLFGEAVIIALGLLPYMTTRYFSALHLFITNSVMSEAICISLFNLFLLGCFIILTEEKESRVQHAVWLSLAAALLLSLTRGQMMITILLWAVVVCVRTAVDRDRRFILRLVAVILITVATFSMRTMAVKSYNLVFNDYFINNTYGTVNTLTNILYSADREDGENIKDEVAKAFFYRMYDLTEESRANYKYAGDSWSERVEHIEEWHDTVKYEMIEKVFYKTYNKTVTSNYVIQNLMADETAGKIISGILPKCFGRWFGNYLLLAGYGLIRSIAVVHPVINWMVLFFYLSAITITLRRAHRSFKEEGRISSSVWLMMLALLAIAANAFAVSLTIMALSRYMIYGFTIFYTAYFILAVEWLRGKGIKKGVKNHGI